MRREEADLVGTDVEKGGWLGVIGSNCPGSRW